MRVSVNLLLTWLWVMYETYPSEAQNEVPEQEECKIHQAMVFDPALIPKVNSTFKLKNLLLGWYDLNPRNMQILLQLFAILLYQNLKPIYPYMPLDGMFSLFQLPKEWFVARATLRTVLPEGVPEPTINSCSPMSK